MINFFNPLRQHNRLCLFFAFLLFSGLNSFLLGQCNVVSGKIIGSTYQDYNNNGALDNGELGHEGIDVVVYDENNDIITSTVSQADGSYELVDLVDGRIYKVVFSLNSGYTSSKVGVDNQSTVQFVEAPACNISFGLVPVNASCGENPDLITTCFVQGPVENSAEKTIVGFKHNFQIGSPVVAYATHEETGSVWGIAWKSSTSEIYSSAFVKQYAALKSTHGSIFSTKVSPGGNYTQEYVDLTQYVDLGTLTTVDVEDCAYGDMVGKVGLGNMVLSDDEQNLYVTNLWNKSIVKVSTKDPTDVQEFKIPDPGCSDGNYAVFALKQYQGKFYIGVTCTAETSGNFIDSKAIIYEWNETAPNAFNQIFETHKIKGTWAADVPESIATVHWFTDLDFVDENHIIMGLSDRVGHRYCHPISNRLDAQSPDILMVYKDKDGKWQLESGGKTDNLVGSGVGNGQGLDGNGEFFGFDFWPGAPSYHPETALGSVYVYPGSDAVIAMVYDPHNNSYSGGVHRYSTKNGSLLGALELYTRNPNTLFGKATGFGDIVSKCESVEIEIGNFVWRDTNGNGIQDAGEDPVKGLNIQLLDDNCQVLATQVTDENGNYLFENLTSGTQYYLSIPSSQLDDYGLLTVENETFVFIINDQGDDIQDSDAQLLNTHCNNIIIPVATSGTNHTFDIGLAESSGFDLALRKTILDQSIAQLNDIIPFRISIFNQGGIPANNVKVVDYIPEGYEFIPSENPGWDYADGIATRTITQTILPTASYDLTIKLKMISADLSKLVIVAEIAYAEDHNGNVVEDVDSIMDEDKDNDVGGQVNSGNDDNISDDGTLDEDDSDPAIPNIFDLALRQSYEDANCVTGGEDIIVKIDIYNQGNLPSRSFQITNYGSPILNFNQNKNPQWNLVNGLLVYEGGEIAPGNMVSVELVFEVYNTSGDIDVINYAEISSSIPAGRNQSVDSDSTPDQNVRNDKGGKPNTGDDNYIFGSADTEEDDHDPIVIKPRSVDMALIITSDSRVVQSGQEVCFDIIVTNQGFMPVSGVLLSNYVPNGLDFGSNPGWFHLRENIYQKVIQFKNNLIQGEEYVEQICMTVTDLTDIYAIENYAEISSIKGICGEDLSLLDIDSQSDDNQANDLGGHPHTETDDSINLLPQVDEDDHDVALLINAVVKIASDCDYKCPATEPGNGIINSTIEINAPSGMTWRIDQGVGYYDKSSTAGNPIALNIGEVLTPGPGLNPGESVYTFTGAFISGEPYTARFKSDNNDFVYFNSGGVCAYKSFPVIGPVASCITGVATYILDDPSSDQYLSSVSMGAGDIISTANNGKSVTVNWNGTPGNHELRFVNEDDCEVEPIIYKVVTGIADNSMKCKSSINLSLNMDCEVEVTPDHIIAGVPTPDAAYVIMLTYEGEAIPGNIVNSTHVGKTITAKLIEGCGGNSCWGEILVEDKMKPTILCDERVTVSCYKAGQYQGPVALDNCGDPVQLHLLDSAYYEEECQPIIGYFLKEYQAVDAYGNLSDICAQRIDVERVRLDSIKFPPNMTMLNALACSDYMEDENRNPHPLLTGIPTLEGDSIWPYFDNFCNLIVTYQDEGPYPFECAEKIIRRWTVWDGSCYLDQKITYREQTLVIADKTAPTITCPDPIHAITSYSNCEAKIRVPAATGITDDCDMDPTVDIYYPGGSRFNQNGGYDIFVGSGTYTMQYTVTDDCDNSTTCETTIVVSDEAAPLAVCDQNTTVALNSQGEAYIYAMTIDDGSYDACGIVSMLVKRDDDGAACNNPVDTFATTIDFCCEDVSPTAPVVVILQVMDEKGNKNTCEANVFVQDKTPPAIHCPDNEVILCTDHYELDSLHIYGIAVATDACEMDTMYVEISENVNSCRVGYIDRTFIASDGSSADTCVQRITVEKADTFKFSDISWPEDYTMGNACLGGSLEPDSLPVGSQRPQLIGEGVCDLVSFAHKDKIWQFNDTLGTCFKIRRRWTVINYCDTVDASDPNNVKFREIYRDQIIKVSKTMPPTITSDLSHKTAFTDAASCTEGTIVLEATAVGCLPNEQLNWSFEVFLNGSLTPEPRVGPFPGTFAVASGIYPLGDHIIQWSFEDNCGNVTTQSQQFSIVNDKKPSVVCVDTVIVSLVAMVDNNTNDSIEMGCIWPDSLYTSATHPCYPIDSLAFSFNEFNTLDIACFDCFDLGLDSVSLYAIDPDSNFHSCKVIVKVQDNNNVDFCPTLEDCIIAPAPVELNCNETAMNIDTSKSKPIIDPDCACTEYTLSYVDTTQTLVEPGCINTIREWTITFTCGNSMIDYSVNQNIIKKNDKLPNYSCPAHIVEFVEEETCTKAIDFDLDPFVFTEFCNTGVEVSYEYTIDGQLISGIGTSFEDDFPAGITTIVTFTIQDDCNMGSCTTEVTITDNIPPDAVCSTNPVEVELNNDGEYQLTGADLEAIGSASKDNCTPDAELMFSVSRGTFNCEDADQIVEIEFYVTDESTNVDTCNAEISVIDNIPPVANCNNITVYLEGDGTYELTEADLTALSIGTTDNCSDEFEITASQDNFQCQMNLGDNSVLVTVEDAYGTNSTCMATVTVIDSIAPTAVCNDITVNLFTTGIITLSNAHINSIAAGSSDNCAINFSVNMNSFTCANTGDNPVLLTVTETVGNQLQDTCTATVTVNDVLPPDIGSCNNITITLDTDGMYEFSMSDYNMIAPNADDNCSFVFSSSKDFDCEDVVNSPVPAIITITDPAGLTDECTIDVTVNNNDSLMCLSNPAITIYLPNDPPASSYNLNIDEIDAGSSAGCFGVMREIDNDELFCNDLVNSPITVTLTVWVPGVDTSTCTTLVTVLDTFPPTITCLPFTVVSCDTFDGNFDAFDAFDLMDNCMATLEVDTTSTIDNTNGCGRGTFSREFVVTDAGGNTDACTMTIMVEGPVEPTEMSDFNLPADITIDNCTDTDTSITGSVTIDNSLLDCEYFEITFTDNPSVLPDACIDTLIRTWTMTDTCSTSNTVITYEQMIVVQDTVSPLLSLTIMGDTLEIDNPMMICEFFIDLSGIVVDGDCHSTNTMYTNNSPFADDLLSLDASGVYEGGTYNITFTALDSCGNADTISFVLVVEAAVYTFSCEKVIEPIDSLTLMACVPFSDVATLTGVCDTNYTIVLYDEFADTSYLETDTDTLKFDCSRVGDNVFLVYLFQDSTLVDSCTVRSDNGRTLITITDPTGACDTTTAIGRVSGLVTTQYTTPVPAVRMQLGGSDLEYQMTNSEGAYAFPAMPTSGDYMVKPYKNDDVLNGVSTLDLILIQRHILKLDELHSNFDLIAADINNDDRINVLDLLELRKVILGINSEFKNNTSWKMIDRTYEFPIVDNPFAEDYPMEYELEALNGNRVVDFIGVKIGDVNGTYEPNARSLKIDPRSSGKMIVKDSEIVRYQDTELRFAFEGFDYAYGLQTSIEIENLFTLEGVRGSDQNVIMDYHVIGQTIVLTLYSDELIDMSAFEILVSCQVRENGKLSEKIRLDAKLKSEVYNGNLKPQSLGLGFRSEAYSQLNVIIDQNKPNPWSDQTFIDYKVPNDGPVKVSISDMSGRVLHRENLMAKKGQNRFEITSDDVNQKTGVFMVIFYIDGKRYIHKMIRIK